jgi:hypothetical protein
VAAAAPHESLVRWAALAHSIMESTMITIQPLLQLDTSDLGRIVATYVSEGIYAVTYYDTPTDTSFELHYITLPEPTVRTYEHF